MYEGNIYLFDLLALSGVLLIFRQTEKGPNLIFILIDDVGWADFGYNNKIRSLVGEEGVSDGQIPTPNIDRLAESGLKLKFTQLPLH